MSRLSSLPTRRRAIGLLSLGALLLAAALWCGFSASIAPRAYAGKGGGSGGTTANYTKVQLGMYTNHINDLGVVVGGLRKAVVIDPLDADDDAEPDTWFLDADGDGYNDLITVLPELATSSTDIIDSSALASNEFGEIVGWSDVITGGQRPHHTAALWRNGTVIDLGALLAGHISEATDINASGQVVGWTTPDTSLLSNDISSNAPIQYFLIDPLDTDGDGAPDTWLVDDGFGGNALMVDVTVVPPAADGIYYHPPHINDSGWICLNQAVSGALQPFVIIPQDADGDGAADTWFRDADGDGVNDLAHELTKPKGKGAWANGLNSGGVVVGRTDYDATVWTVTADGGSKAGSLGSPKGPYPHGFSSAHAVNDAGQIVGNAYYHDNQTYALNSDNVCLWQDANDKGTLLDGYDNAYLVYYSNSINNYAEIVAFGELLLPNAP
jgi:hypothetical protein